MRILEILKMLQKERHKIEEFDEEDIEPRFNGLSYRYFHGENEDNEDTNYTDFLSIRAQIRKYSVFDVKESDNNLLDINTMVISQNEIIKDEVNKEDPTIKEINHKRDISDEMMLNKSDLMTQFLLTLLHIKGLGLNTVKQIGDSVLGNILDFKGIIMFIQYLKLNDNSICIPSIEEIKIANFESKKIITICKSNSIEIINYKENKYPQKLLKIPDPPVIVFAKGNLNCLNNASSVAVIGTREPTAYGRKIAVRFGEVFGERNFSVVSVLNIGCDTYALMGCLNKNGSIVAVSANGLDYKHSNEISSFIEKIINENGCILSEKEPGYHIKNSDLNASDRLCSGLSDAVVVVEAEISGETMQIVNFCIKQKRILACFNHPISKRTEKSNGNQQLMVDKLALSISNEVDINRLVELIVE